MKLAPISRTLATVLLTFTTVAPLRAPADAPAPKEKLEYVKPDDVASKTRVIAKSPRSGSKHVPPDVVLVVLCPDHTSKTVQEHPSIFWFLNKPVADVKYKLTVTSDNEPEPLFEKELDSQKDVGIQRLNLADIPKSLAPDVDYRVSVALIDDPKDRSQDMVASGLFKRVKAPERLLAKLLSRPTPGERAIVYARQGMFCDALTSISDQIKLEPANKDLRLQRAELLKSIDLTMVADYDAK